MQSYTLSDLDNALVEQKNVLLVMLAEERYLEVHALLSFVSPLWKKVNYAYKEEEIRARLKEELSLKLESSEHHKTKSKWAEILKQVS